MAIRSAAERSRSPRFPGYSIGQAIEYARKIYGGVHRSTVPSDTVFRLMGFAGKSGPSSAALGALRQFGLIEGMGDRTRLTELALTIVQPSSEDERIEGIRQAARNPEVFQMISDRFDGRVPGADEPILAYLIRELGFSKRGAEECLNSLRKTLRTLEELTGEPAFERRELTQTNTYSEGVEPSKLHAEDNPAASQKRLPSDDEALIRIPLTRDCTAELRFVGPVNQRAIDNLTRHIELMREVWAEEE